MEQQMKVYGELNGSMQQIGGTKPEGFVEMEGLRPENGDYVASSEGMWIIDLDREKEKKIQFLNEQASVDLLTGFWYKLPHMEEELHFSYQVTDQINFIDAINYIGAILAANPEHNEIVNTWNGYKDLGHTQLVVVPLTARQFQDLYANGAIMAKQAKLYKVELLKEQVRQATTLEEIQNVVYLIE